MLPNITFTKYYLSSKGLSRWMRCHFPQFLIRLGYSLGLFGWLLIMTESAGKQRYISLHPQVNLPFRARNSHIRQMSPGNLIGEVAAKVQCPTVTWSWGWASPSPRRRLLCLWQHHHTWAIEHEFHIFWRRKLRDSGGDQPCSDNSQLFLIWWETRKHFQVRQY